MVLFFVDTYEYNPIQYLIPIRGYLASGGTLLVVVLFFVDTYEYNPSSRVHVYFLYINIQVNKQGPHGDRQDN